MYKFVLNLKDNYFTNHSSYGTVPQCPHFIILFSHQSTDHLCGLVLKSSWLRIRKPGLDSRHYQIFWKKNTVVGLERGPLSLVSTTEELLHRKVAAPV
jgi:hypothetical protein